MYDLPSDYAKQKNLATINIGSQNRRFSQISNENPLNSVQTNSTPRLPKMHSHRSLEPYRSIAKPESL